MIRILIADDHALIRGGLAQLIALAGDMIVAAEAVNGTETLDLVQNKQCDVILLDMDMPGPGGVELIGCLREKNPSLPILVLSMHNEGQIVRRALTSGASGYISKSSDPRVLTSAIRKVAAGGRFIDPALVDVTLFDAGVQDPSPQDVLTAREQQVLRMIGAGQPLGEIAARLHLSPKTISTHKMRLMKKLAINNNADLVLFAFRHQEGDGNSSAKAAHSNKL